MNDTSWVPLCKVAITHFSVLTAFIVPPCARREAQTWRQHREGMRQRSLPSLSLTHGGLGKAKRTFAY